MYECESWTIKKAECWRIDVFELWCWRRLLWVAFDCKEIQPVHLKGDQPWVFIGRTDVEAETPILWPPDSKSWLIWKDSDAGKDWGQEEKRTTGWDGWMASPTQWTWVWVNSGSWWWTGRPGVLQFMGSQSWTQLSDWTELKLLEMKTGAKETTVAYCLESLARRIRPSVLYHSLISLPSRIF